MTDLSGQYLGRYYLAERLGEGGMAVVYKAYDTRLERDVAIKIIRSGVFPPDDLEQVLKRFEREAKALAKLSHPNIVKVHDYGEHEGSPYLVMEYLPGGTLKNIVGNPLPWRSAIRLILPIARGVAYAHQHGILHRDIKPANILITDSGEPMLSDFGIAKLFEGEKATTLTESGMAIGTPQYMAPEQWTGETSPQSDLYSLGIVLYELTAGRKPYEADTPASILLKQATEPLPSPRKFVSDLPEALEKSLIKALAKEPTDRYQTMDAFVGALESLHVGVSVISSTTHKNIERMNKVTSQKPEVSILARLPKQEGGETVRGAELTESRKVDEPLSAPVRQVGRSRWVVILGIIFALVVGVLALTGRFNRFIYPPLSMEWVTVPAGDFQMGSDSGDPDESPIHTVYLGMFEIGKYEVTNRQYTQCVKAGVCLVPYSSVYRIVDFANHPVVDVSWFHAITFCRWIDPNGRLPTEAEWEKAARGMDGRTYPWGEGINDTYANYNQNNEYSTPVGIYPKGVSPYDVYDMAGNVWEWVTDWYDGNYYTSSPQVNPLGSESGDYRVLRGGSWNFNDFTLRSSKRYMSDPTVPNNDIGFRCARSP